MTRSHRQPITGSPPRQTTDAPIRGLGAIVMAAGLGKRMRSKLVKVLHPVAGRPMILFAVDLAERLAGSHVAVVVGHQSEPVKEVVEGRARTKLQLVEQREQLGTGHAVMQARQAILHAYGRPADRYVIINGDTPLLTDATVRHLLRLHEEDGAEVTILTALVDDPSGYGRVVRRSESLEREATGRVVRIAEDRDAVGPEKLIREINVGTYVVNGPFLFEALDKLEPKNSQHEYYLTDIVSVAVERGLRVSALPVENPDEGLGINTRRQLAAAGQVMRLQICSRWMDAGVTIHDPTSALIDVDVQLGPDTVLYPHVALEGRTTVGQDCILRSHVRVADSRLGNRVVIQDSCVIEESLLEDDVTVGPFAHLRPGSVVRRGAKVGNFVEMKKTELGEGSKANHLSYLGDTKVGKGVNIGAGTITCNYDGERKYETIIEDDVFIGSDTQLVAPVTVGRGAVVAAGATITNDVPPDALAISRAPQLNRPGWASRRRALPPARNGEVPGVKGEAILKTNAPVRKSAAGKKSRRR